ncbi:MAG: hypothetical protein DRJ15_14285 [Bacteroidetes bacterium]|nr:MAG: hypothetical protein DRJ15_14285 [Bacteroidota bacterium]
MSLVALMVIAFIAAGSVIYLVSYMPLESKMANTQYSPRLLLCKLLAPFDVVATLFLVIGPVVGFSVVVAGIGVIVYSTFVGVGLSCGIIFMKKVMIPKWKIQYDNSIGLNQGRL